MTPSPWVLWWIAVVVAAAAASVASEVGMPEIMKFVAAAGAD